MPPYGQTYVFALFPLPNYLLFLAMADVHNKATRSYNMSRIRGSNTKPEMLVRRFLFARGFRYRLHVKDLPGNPDISNRETELVRRAML